MLNLPPNFQQNECQSFMFQVLHIKIKNATFDTVCLNTKKDSNNKSLGTGHWSQK